MLEFKHKYKSCDDKINLFLHFCRVRICSLENLYFRNLYLFNKKVIKLVKKC